MKEFVEKLEKVGKGLDLVQRDTQTINAKVESLSKEKEDMNKCLFMRVKGRNSSDSGRNSWSSKSERHEKHDKKKRSGREEKKERYERRREEPKEEEMDMTKCKIPLFFGNCNLDKYVNWELKVEQILNYFNLHGRKVVRLVTIDFGDYALVWWI
ncbi:hypothetical protein CR513_36620, partial [Mucuna pruriens]